MPRHSRPIPLHNLQESSEKSVKAVIRESLTGHVASVWDVRRPSERRTEGKSIRVISDILS